MFALGINGCEKEKYLNHKELLDASLLSQLSFKHVVEITSKKCTLYLVFSNCVRKLPFLTNINIRP